jgi:hypothetical protein
MAIVPVRRERAVTAVAIGLRGTVGDVTRPSDDRLRSVFDLVERRIEDRWGIPVLLKDVPHPFTGDLDGAEIHVDHENDVEDAVFIVAHLFGHTVQWNVSPEARDIGMTARTTWSEDELRRLRHYEQEACRYSMQLFHDCGVHDLDGWLSDFAACDLAYLEHAYRTGEKLPFRSFWRDGTPALTPLSIPEFHPTRWWSRWSGVVI